MEIDENIVTSEANEERTQERLSVVATFGILAATIAAAIAGSLAALAAVHADSANSARVAWATYSNELLLADNQHTVAQNENTTVRIEDAWRLHLLEILAEGTPDPILRADLGTEAALSGSGSNLATVPQTSFAPPGAAQVCRGAQPNDCAYEMASAYGTTALNDDRQERVYIACVSMLAIALFLFALSKMLSQASMERLFLVLGTVITVIAVGWMVANPIVTPATQPSAAAIRAYERGWRLEQQGQRPATVAALLERATSADPSLADAWEQLGQEELLQVTKGSAAVRCSRAIAALTRAWQIRQATDDLDRLAVGQALCDEPRRALTTLRTTAADPSDTSAGPALALVQLASGRSAEARSTLDAAVRTMEHQGSGVRGPVFRTYWFDQLRTEVAALEARGHAPSGLHAFRARMLHDEMLATLGDYGVHLPTAAPNARVDVHATVATTFLGSAAGLWPVVVGLTYAGLRNGDVIAVTWDLASTVENSRQVALTLPGADVMVVGQPGAPPAGSGSFVLPTPGFVPPGRYRLDVSLDAVPVTGPVITIPRTGSNPGNNPSPLVFAQGLGSPNGPSSSSGCPTTTTTTTTTTIPGERSLAFTC
jgi:hypothetical protein